MLVYYYKTFLRITEISSLNVCLHGDNIINIPRMDRKLFSKPRDILKKFSSLQLLFKKVKNYSLLKNGSSLQSFQYQRSESLLEIRPANLSSFSDSSPPF
jgi:hypothetical protein